MRPFVRTLSSKICAITSLGDGYAATTETGVELVSLELASIATIPAAPGVRELWGTDLRVLPDGRFVACSRGTSFGGLYVGRRGGVMESVISASDYVFPPLLTQTGFVAAMWQQPSLVVDTGGNRRTIPLPLPPSEGTVSGQHLALMHETRLVLVDAGGALVAGQDVPRFSTLLSPVAGYLAVRSVDAIALLDPASLERIDTITLATKQRVPLLEHDGDLVRIGDDFIERLGRWRVRMKPQHVMQAGDHLVVWTGKDTRVVALATGAVTMVAVTAPNAVGVLGDGLVIAGTPTVWWRPGQTRELVHDFTPKLVASVPAGAVTADRRQLYLWRPTIDGPEVSPVSTTLPFGVPIIAEGAAVIVKEARGHSLICEINGHERPLSPDVAWRYPLTGADARTIIDRLLARDLDGELPAAARAEVPDATALIQLPPLDLVPLVGRGLFERERLNATERVAADVVLGAFLREVCGVVKLRPRALLAALRAGMRDVKPPFVIPSFDYLGSFTTQGTVWVADPCHYNKRARSPYLASTLEVRPGTWHAYVRGDEPTQELVAVHADGFAVAATAKAGSIGVDAGVAGVFDDACPPIRLDYGVEEGICDGLGVVASSGHGDGGYPFYTGVLGREIAKIRIGFTGDAATDRSAGAARPTAGRAYSAKAHFAVGEAIDHPTFGLGTVTSARDTKIDVAFADAPRTLVHAKR